MLSLRGKSVPGRLTCGLGIFQGARPSATVVKFLSGFAVGAMLGDAFIHQLPHAFAAAPAHAHSHAHSAWDTAWAAIAQQAVGLSCLAGIGVFFLVEKIILHYGGTSIPYALLRLL